MANKSKEMVWKKIWKLFILKISHSDKYWKPILLCKCDCWNEKLIRWESIRYWNTLSCWCKRNTKHWLSNTRWNNIYQWMKQRCYNIRHDAYNNYWWRWITICDSWLSSIENFYEDMKEWYSDDLTIDRIDNNWNYCKKNCKWSTKKEQSNNTRLSINPTVRIIIKESRKNILYIIRSDFIIHKWIWKTLSEWCRHLNIPYTLVSSRIGTCWYTKKEALWLIPLQKKEESL